MSGTILEPLFLPKLKHCKRQLLDFKLSNFEKKLGQVNLWNYKEQHTLSTTQKISFILKYSTVFDLLQNPLLHIYLYQRKKKNSKRKTLKVQNSRIKMSFKRNASATHFFSTSNIFVGSNKEYYLPTKLADITTKQSIPSA